MAWISTEISYSVFLRLRYIWLWLHVFHKLGITAPNNVLIIHGNNLATRVIRWKGGLRNCASQALFNLNFSSLQNILNLSLSRYFYLPFDSIAIASAVLTRWSIANIKHSFEIVVFSIAFSCRLYNIPLRLSDSILLGLPANTDCSSTPTKNPL